MGVLQASRLQALVLGGDTIGRGGGAENAQRTTLYIYVCVCVQPIMHTCSMHAYIHAASLSVRLSSFISEPTYLAHATGHATMSIAPCLARC